MIILLVTPTKNAEQFLDETIFSIVSQIGDFELHYHIQDSQSSDTTIAIIRKWEQILSNSETIFQARFQRPKILFSWASEKDTGMYDAINRGFANLLSQVDRSSREKIVMSWLNGDDTFVQGAFQTVTQFFEATEYRWITGNPCLIKPDSAIADLRDSPFGFSRYLLRKGLHDGRQYHFLQQEGTFWRWSLWEEVGALNASLQLAGDWDLWRRFAACSDLVTLKAVLGFHRRRHGQLSSDMGTYYQEVDTTLSKDTSPVDIDNPQNDYLLALVGGWNTDTSQWEVYQQKIAVERQQESIDLSSKMHEKAQEISDLQAQIEILKSDLAYLSTTKEAIRKLIKATLKKIKLYNLAYQNYSFFVPIYNFFFRDRWTPLRASTRGKANDEFRE